MSVRQGQRADWRKYDTPSFSGNFIVFDAVTGNDQAPTKATACGRIQLPDYPSGIP